ncbi:MAG: transcription-repair coupling factor, partial [Sandaracinobacteroides sp.]
MILPIEAIAGAPEGAPIAGAPAGLLPWLMAGLARHAGLPGKSGTGRRAVLIAADEAAGRAVVEAAPFFAPDLATLWLPGWDCLPYDRASPAQKVLADRLGCLARLARAPRGAELLVTTVAAAAQRLLPGAVLAEA